MSHHGLRFRFWGVRGSIATPGPQTVRYGGNTPCVEVQAGERLLIIDGGTGLKGLGDALLRRGQTIVADIFLSHFHWDHIQGIPFFRPAFIPGNRLRFFSLSKPDFGLRSVLEAQMNDPNFPVPLSRLSADIEFVELDAGVRVELGEGAYFETFMLNHPNGSLGVRVVSGEKVLAYACDTEHDPVSGNADPEVVRLAAGADALIYDSMYTDDEYRSGRDGWGHSTYTEAIRVARAAQARRVYFFHHDPSHSDDFLDSCLADARKLTQGESLEVFFASEGQEIIL